PYILAGSRTWVTFGTGRSAQWGQRRRGIMTEQASRDDVAGVAADRTGAGRTTTWALVVGACGVVVAIVALVIAISANHTTNDNAKIAKAVRTAESRQITGVRADLQRNVA